MKPGNPQSRGNGSVNVGAIVGAYEESLDALGEAIGGDDDAGAIVSRPEYVAQRLVAVQQGTRLPRKVARVVNALSRAAGEVKRLDTALKMERRMSPNGLITVCVDGLTTGQESGLITVATPHNGQPWTITDLLVDAKCPVGRISELDIAGIDFAEGSRDSVTVASPGTPTHAGIDLAVFHHDKTHTAAKSFKPWVGYALKSDGVVKLKIVNPTGSTASYMVTFMVRSSPCNAAFRQMVEQEKLQKVLSSIWGHRFAINS